MVQIVLMALLEISIFNCSEHEKVLLSMPAHSLFPNDIDLKLTG